MPYYRASWYSQLPAFGWFDREDRPGSNALGVPDWQQGIALPSRRTLGQWFNVTPPGSSIPYPMQQTDTGPAWWTGRGVDISAAGAHQMGYTPQSFPTNATFRIEPRDEPRALGSPAGLPVDAGDLPDNAVEGAYAGPTPGGGRRKMDSLMDMLQPQQQQQSFGDRLGGMSNSLIGLGMGLLQPYDPYRGTNAWTNALRGYQTGAALDQEQAQNAWRRNMAERQFALSQVTDFQKAAKDLGLAPGSPEFVKFAQSYYAPKTEDWLQGTWEDPRTEAKYPYQVHKRTGEVRWLNLPGVTAPGAQPGPPQTAAPQAPSAPSVFDTGTPGVGYGRAGAGTGGFGTGFQREPGSTAPTTPAPEPSPNAPVAQGAQQQFKTGPKAQELAHNIRKEINALPEVKRISEAMPIFRSMVQSHNVSTRAADLDFVYGVAKIFDPDSVVREGEMKLVGQARTIPEEIQGWMSRVVENKAALPPEVRQRILEVAAIRMNQLNESYKQRIEPYRRQLQQSNLDPGIVMPQMLDMPAVTGPADATSKKIPTYNLQTGKFE